MAKVTARKLTDEFSHISGTSFWEAYTTELCRIRDLAKSHLMDENISIPVVKGNVYQEQIKQINFILGLPERIIKNFRETENSAEGE